MLPAHNARRAPNKAALIDEEGTLTYKELDEAAHAVANGLIAKGVRGGDGVALLARNHRWFVIANYGAARAGARIILLNSEFSGPQIKEVAEREGAKVIIYDDEYTKAVSKAEQPLGKLRVRACPAQAEQLVAWAQAWPERTWAVEGAPGLGRLLAQQLVAAGERVCDVQPKLAARVRLLQTGRTGKSDPNDALSVAVAALRSATRREVIADDHATVLKVWANRHRDLSRARNQIACRLHAVLCELIPGGVPDEITAGRAARILGQIRPAGAVAQARRELAAERR